MPWLHLRRSQRRLLVTCWALFSLSIVLAALPGLLPEPLSAPDDLSTTLVPRQRVVIFIIDTEVYFDAHGAYVRSVIQQQCPTCALHLVNLHGDLSLLTLNQALRHVYETGQTYEGNTTALVNLSLGTYTHDAGLHASVQALDAIGITLIASAGNDNVAQPFYPAAFPEVFAVCSSTRHTNTKAAYSNFGSWVSLCAPGLQYVSRPLQHGEMASGTSFASPMVAGVLGQLLLDTPCASPRAGLRALRRTAGLLAMAPPELQAGILNATAAAQYMRALYPCQPSQPEGYVHRLFTRLQHLGSQTVLYLGLLLYFLVSIFAFPFLLAFLIDRLEQRTARREYQAIFHAYAATPEYRQHRLAVLQQDWRRTHRVRRRDRAELTALLHALHLYGEPCRWCEQPATVPLDPAQVFAGSAQCSRCGWDITGRQAPLANVVEEDATD